MQKRFLIRHIFCRPSSRVPALWLGLLLTGDLLLASTVIGAPPGLVALHEGKLSVQVADTPLWQVLAEVGRLSHTQVIWLDDEGKERQVSVEFTELPLAEGLERILRHKNFLLFYAETPTEERLTQIWVSSDRGTDQPPVTIPEASAGTPPSREKEAGQGERVTVPAGDVMQEVSQIATSDPSPSMRANAISYLGAHAQDDPQAKETLEQIAKGDTNVRIRKAAVEALQGVESTVR
jgi:HEAT repeat protein